MNTTTKQGGKIIVTLIGKVVLIAIAFFILSFKSSAQQNKTLGVSMAAQINANGYGGTYQPGIYLRTVRRVFLVSPVLQIRNNNISGVQFNYLYSVTGEDISGVKGEPELFFYAMAAYNYSAVLGKRALWEESMADRSFCEKEIASIRFKSVEIFGGLGLKIKFLRNFKWVSSIGVGGYTSFNFPQAKNLYYTGNNIGLALRTGITFAIHN